MLPATFSVMFPPPLVMLLGFCIVKSPLIVMLIPAVAALMLPPPAMTSRHRRGA
jgi:hypothetical protein